MQWSPKLLTDIIRTPGIDAPRIVLHDLNQDNADLIARYAGVVARHLNREAEITVEADLGRALDGADYVIITVSTGGLDAMEIDVTLPEDYGIYHTVGDTSGPGGWSRLVRNFGVFQGFAEAIAKYAPGALVLNYTNPLTTLTDVLSRLSGVPVVGLCHGLFDNIAILGRIYGVEEADLALSYGGLNHCYFVTRARIGDLDVIADLLARVGEGQSLTAMESEAGSGHDLGGHTSNRELATELLRLTGVLPYLADRHTSEFLSWTINDLEAMARYRLVRTPIDERRANQRRWVDEIGRSVTDGPTERQLEHTREAAADIIRAHWNNRPYVDVGNLPNHGQVPGLPHGVVVETAVQVDRNGFTPLAIEPLPRVALQLLEGPAAMYQMVVDACLHGDRKLALQALRIDPTTARLGTPQVEELGSRLLAAHERYISCF